MLILEAIEKAGKELLEKAIVEGGRAMADKAGLDYDRLVSELTHLGEATYKEMPEMREAIDRKIADELAQTAELTDGYLPFSEDGVVVANTNIFLRTDENDALYAAEPIRVTFNRSLLEIGEFDYYTAVSTLYHEMIHVMQQVAVIEGGAFTYAEMAKEWEQDIRTALSPDGVNQLDELYTEYLSEPMETYAHMQQAYFELMLQGMEKEYAASAA